MAHPLCAECDTYHDPGLSCAEAKLAFRRRVLEGNRGRVHHDNRTQTAPIDPASVVWGSSPSITFREVWSVPCPHCEAEAGQNCRTHTGYGCRTHAKRVKLAQAEKAADSLDTSRQLCPCGSRMPTISPDCPACGEVNRWHEAH